MDVQSQGEEKEIFEVMEIFWVSFFGAKVNLFFGAVVILAVKVFILHEEDVWVEESLQVS